jgi:hypothetical protein
MAENGSFNDFDNETVYRESQVRALDESTHNFVVEFGKSNAQIAFNLGTGDVKKLFESERDEEKPVRWMYAVSIPSALLS